MILNYNLHSLTFLLGSTALNRIEKVLTNKRCLTDVEKLAIISRHCGVLLPKTLFSPSLECYASMYNQVFSNANVIGVELSAETGFVQ